MVLDILLTCNTWAEIEIFTKQVLSLDLGKGNIQQHRHKKYLKVKFTTSKVIRSPRSQKFQNTEILLWSLICRKQTQKLTKTVSRKIKC